LNGVLAANLLLLLANVFEGLMLKKINLRILFTILLSIVDDAIVFAVVLIVLPRLGIGVPAWAIALLAVFFAANILVSYYSIRKNPQMGFENMIGKSGVAVEPVGRKGTVRIGRELWFARTDGKENIEAGTEITVTGQSGLKLVVKRLEK
jgi:membrane-bound ClpP family serine protease